MNPMYFFLVSLLAKIKQFLGLGLAIGAIILGIWGGWPQPAQAGIHRYPLEGDRALCRSLQSLRDDHDRSWQLVLFAESQNNQPPVTGFRLRVVGFPTLRIDRERSLIITNSTGAIAQLTDSFPKDSMAFNTGEYDLDSVVSRLNQIGIIRLNLPLSPEDQTEIPVPPFVLQEWTKLQQKGCPES